MLISAIDSRSAARPAHLRSDAPLYVVQSEQPGVGRFCSYRIGREDRDEPHIYIMRETTPDTMWIGIELPVGKTWQTDDPLTVSVDGQNWTLPPSDNGHGQRARNIALSVSP